MRTDDPRHYYLNETHELPPLEAGSGGRAARYAPVDWLQRSQRLDASLANAISNQAASPDPTSADHLFVAAIPATVTKLSTAKKHSKAGGKVSFTPAFGGEQAMLLPRLGMDVLTVVEDGSALVHVPKTRIPQIQARLARLPHASSREQNRWIGIEKFDSINADFRLDMDWWRALTRPPSIVVLKFHGALRRTEVDDVLGAIDLLLEGRRQGILRRGRDFSGRYWCYAMAARRTIRSLALDFPSISAIHAPMGAHLVAARRPRSRKEARSKVKGTPKRQVVDVSSLPAVGMLDGGVSKDHPVLSHYVINRIIDPDLDTLDPELSDALQSQHGSYEPSSSHGSYVASALVFGDIGEENANSQALPPAACRIYDLQGTWTNKETRFDVPDEVMVGTIRATLALDQSVRVFNLSLAGPRLATLKGVSQREKLAQLQDLENLSFARDVLLVIAAGNSPPGVQPKKDYPKHVDEESWQLGVLATAFNGIVVGAYVGKSVESGIARQEGAPSPFTCIGPGRLKAPVPSFGAPGGDARHGYTFAHHSGVWCLSKDGTIEDVAGTSVAAPIVARQCAMAFRHLEPYCPDGRPFAATVRAWMTMTSRRPSFDGALGRLAKRTLGGGLPSAQTLRDPDPQVAVFVWQAVLQDAGVVARVLLPVPREWLSNADSPTIRVVVAALTPVNASLTHHWACRKVSSQLKPGLSERVRALTTAPGTRGAFPVSDRVFDVSQEALEAKSVAPTEDYWCVQVSYSTLGPPPVGMRVTSQQRVGVVVELRDAGGLSPQPFVDALHVPSMTRLSVPQVAPQVPVRVTT